MTREIKFRAWDKVQNKMFYGEELSGSTCDGFRRLEHFMTKETGLNAMNVGPSGDGYNLEIMQFTGLKDKNDTEIYEGDIVIDTEYKTVKEVVWRNNGFKLKYTYQRRYMGEKYTETNYLELRETDSRRWGLEVIGNVFDNPELLEGEVE